LRAGEGRLDELAISEDPLIANLDKHVAERAMPHVSEDILHHKREARLESIASLCVARLGQPPVGIPIDERR
jgi:hypothetical protein